MILSLIAAASEKNVIGNRGALPWKLPKDMKHFRELTDGHPVIMGRKTFESIGRPLPNRRNLIISRSLNEAPLGCELFHSLGEALMQFIGQDEEIFVIGGGEMFSQVMPSIAPSVGEVLVEHSADKIYLTRVHADVEGDAFFPTIDPRTWRETARERHEADSEHAYAFSFITYERIR